MANILNLKRKVTDRTSEAVNRMRKGHDYDLVKIIEAIYAIEYVENNALEDYEKDAIISYYNNYV